MVTPPQSRAPKCFKPFGGVESYMQPTCCPQTVPVHFRLVLSEHWSIEGWRLVLLGRGKKPLCTAGILLILLSEVFRCVQVRLFERMCCFVFKSVWRLFSRYLEVWKCLEFSKTADTLWCFVLQREPRRRTALYKEAGSFFCVTQSLCCLVEEHRIFTVSARGTQSSWLMCYRLQKAFTRCDSLQEVMTDAGSSLQIILCNLVCLKYSLVSGCGCIKNKKMELGVFYHLYCISHGVLQESILGPVLFK